MLERITAQPGTAQKSLISEQLLAHMKKVVLYEPWLQLPLLNASAVPTNLDPTLAEMALRFRANRDWEIAGTNAADANISFADGGGITGATAGADNDQVILQPHTDTKQSAWAAIKWNTNDRPGYAHRIKTAASVADLLIHAGLTLTAALDETTDADQIKFTVDGDVPDANIQCNYSIDGTDYQIDSGVAIAASTEYGLEIKIDGDRYGHFFINGEPVAHTHAVLTANIDLIPRVGWQALAAAAKSLTVRPIGMAKDPND